MKCKSVLLLTSLVLVSCDWLDPWSKHKLHFNGIDCVLLDENKKQITEDKEFESGETIHCFIVGKNEEYAVPKQNAVAVTFTSGEQFTDTWEYKEDDGSIFIKMTADITISAHSVSKYQVSAEEMKDALTMKGVEYLQCVATGEPASVPTLGRTELTPTSYRVIKETLSTYEEELILKNGDNYNAYYRDNKEGKYESIEYQGNFMTIPQFLDFLELDVVSKKDYKDFYYSDINKEYMVSEVRGEFTLTIWLIQFYNKKVTNCDMAWSPPGRHVYYSFSYDKKDPPSPTSI